MPTQIATPRHIAALYHKEACSLCATYYGSVADPDLYRVDEDTACASLRSNYEHLLNKLRADWKLTKAQKKELQARLLAIAPDFIS
jgi:hypothetical protein